MKKYLLIMVCFSTIVFSCDEAENKTATNEPINANGTINKDSTSSPEVIPVPAPQIIQAKITTRANPLSDGLGRLYFDNFSAENGYSLGWVYDMFFDNKGMLWLATFRGLLKYDGNNFTTFNAKNGLPNDYVQCIIQDDLDNYWIGTAGGLSKYDGKTFTNFTKADGLIDEYVQGIIEDNAGSLWIGTSKGLSKYDGKSFTNYTIKQDLPAGGVRDLKLDKQGNLWISTWPGGICKYDGNTFKTFSTIDGLISDRVFSSFQDAADNIWICTFNGLSKYDGKQFTNYTTKDGLPSDNIRSAVQDAAGNIWFGTFGGISKYDGRHFVNYTTKDGLINNAIWKLTKDPAGNIWCPTNNGISKLNGVYLSKYTAAEGYSVTDNGYTYMLKDKANNLWFNIPGGIGKYDGQIFSYYNLDISKDSLKDYASGLMMDAGGNIWFHLIRKGLFKFDGKTFTYYPGIRGNGVFSSSSIIPDSKGNIWIASYGKGVTRFDGKTYTWYTTAQGLISNLATCINEDNAGNIWIGTGNGLSKYDGLSFTNYSVKQGLPSNEINSLKFESNGNMWVATSAGLSYYEGTSFTNYDKSDGFADNNIDQIAIDTVENKIWLMTFSGLSTIKTIKQNRNADEKNIQIQSFNFQTGFPVLGSLFMGYYRDLEGVIWLTTSNNNLFRFDYNLVKQIPSPKLAINNITLNNENISWNNLKPSGNKKTDSLALINESNLRFQKTLSPAELKSMAARYKGIRFDSISPGNLLPYHLQIPFQYNSIAFEFSALSPASGNQVRYQYMLEGYDKNWSPLSWETKAVFGNMSAGNYTFRLKALSANGQWTEASYAFQVLPPWYTMWWAYTLYAILFVSGIFLFIRWRTKALQKEKSILEEKVTTRTSELKESLEHLKSTQSQLIQSEKMASLGELTAGIAHEIQNPLNFVNNFSEVNTELIYEVGEEMDKGNITEAKIILNDIKENEQKIIHHGKRAGDIVKSMLQHSRNSSGLKELTDINALCDEYLRLSYHGIRAKDKLFNARFETDFESSIPKLNIIPQDIGRVLLNLINNAFYAVQEKAKQNIAGYEPTVFVSTKIEGNKILISVKDNGNGIPQKILDKIFQPFFTTKPTGQGTGLGLSLAYDIVKASGGTIEVITHYSPPGGELKAESIEGDGSEFSIILPYL